MRRVMILGMSALFLAPALIGCGEGGGTPGGNADAAKVIGTAPDDPNYGTASSDLMGKMHGESLKKAGKKAEAK